MLSFSVFCIFRVFCFSYSLRLYLKGVIFITMPGPSKYVFYDRSLEREEVEIEDHKWGEWTKFICKYIVIIVAWVALAVVVNVVIMNMNSSEKAELQSMLLEVGINKQVGKVIVLYRVVMGYVLSIFIKKCRNVLLLADNVVMQNIVL